FITTKIYRFRNNHMSRFNYTIAINQLESNIQKFISKFFIVHFIAQVSYILIQSFFSYSWFYEIDNFNNYLKYGIKYIKLLPHVQYMQNIQYVQYVQNIQYIQYI